MPLPASCNLGPCQRFQGLGQELRGDPAVRGANCHKPTRTRFRIWGLYRDYIGLYWDYIGILENNMETSICF